MNIESLTIDTADVRKLLGAASGDAALLYLYIHSGGDAAEAAKAEETPATESKEGEA